VPTHQAVAFARPSPEPLRCSEESRAKATTLALGSLASLVQNAGVGPALACGQRGVTPVLSAEPDPSRACRLVGLPAPQSVAGRCFRRRLHGTYCTLHAARCMLQAACCMRHVASLTSPLRRTRGLRTRGGEANSREHLPHLPAAHATGNSPRPEQAQECGRE
jgi:hypothetical protein